jgi:hypothetical protein
MSGNVVFENAFLETLAASFSKRRKAIRHKSRTAELGKAYDVEGEARVERLEVAIDNFEMRLRLHAWPDRYLWVDTRPLKTTKGVGWSWEWTAEGRYASGSETNPIIDAVEETMAGEGADAFDRIWRPLLASGPRLIRR